MTCPRSVYQVLATIYLIAALIFGSAGVILTVYESSHTLVSLILLVLAMSCASLTILFLAIDMGRERKEASAAEREAEAKQEQHPTVIDVSSPQNQMMMTPVYQSPPMLDN